MQSEETMALELDQMETDPKAQSNTAKKICDRIWAGFPEALTTVCTNLLDQISRSTLTPEGQEGHVDAKVMTTRKESSARTPGMRSARRARGRSRSGQPS